MARKNIVPVLVTVPGFFGLNTRQIVQQDLHWAQEAQNCVIDASGRLAARRGRARVTTTQVEAGADIKSIFEQVDSDGTTTIISGINNKLYSGTTVLTDITGTANGVNVFTDDHWQFAVLSDQLVGAQANHDMVIRTTGNFQRLQSQIDDWAATTAYGLGDIVKDTAANEDLYFQATTAGTSGGSEPTWATTPGATTADGTVVWTTRTFPRGNICHSAFGRIWTANAGSAIVEFSDTGVPHKFRGGSAGTLDLRTVWGGDVLTAIHSIEDFIVFFGRRNIVIYDSGEDPANLVLVEKLEGVGCIARDSVQPTGNDLLFLSDSGVRSLARAIEAGGRQALGDLSVNVRTDMMATVAASSEENIKAAYHEDSGFYVLLLTDGQVDWVFDLRFPNEDRSSKVTTWNGLGATAIFASQDRTLHFGHEGRMAKYDGYNDDQTDTYTMRYISSWTDYQSGSDVIPFLGSRFKMPKRWYTDVVTNTNYTVTWLWGFDYATGLSSFDTVLLTGVNPSEWNVAEWGVGEWSGGDVFALAKAHPTGHGRTLRIGWEVTINGAPFAVQAIDFGVVIGRIQ